VGDGDVEIVQRVRPLTAEDADVAGPEEQTLLDTLPPSRRLRSLLRDLDTLIGQEGFLHLGIDDIASRLRCSKASLYRLAPGVDDLIELAIKLRFARVYDAARRSSTVERNWTDRLTSRIESLVREQSQVSFVFMRDLFAFQRTASLIRNYRARATVELQEILQAGIEAGEFQAVNPVVAAQVLSLTIARICEPDFQLSTGLPIVEALEEALRMFRFGIIRPTSTRPHRA
jgi:AcrR family transcriptional regulator